MIDSGELLYENLGTKDKEPSAWKGDIDGLSINIVSKVWNNGNWSEIKINGIDYSVNARGLNIVVFDKQSRILVDSVAFDTHVYALTCIRK